MGFASSVAAAALSVLLAGAATASPCPDRQGRSGAAQRPAKGCEPPKIEPYDPDRVRAGSRPGSIDLGGSTELQVSGRVRAEFESRR